MSVGYTYTEQDKARIKANPLNRENCRFIRAITTRYYRDMQAAERALPLAASDKARKEAMSNYSKAKDEYEKSLSKFKLYKEIFPDIVQ